MSSRRGASWKRTVAVLLLSPTSVFEAAVPCEVFGIDRSDDGVPTYRLLLCAERPGEVPTAMGFSFVVSHGLEALAEAATIVVPGAPAPHHRAFSPALLDAVRSAHARGSRIVSLCSGAFVLAQAGLLDGRRATTHWKFADELGALHPSVDVDASVLYIDHDDVATSAGTAAGIDLCLHLVRRDHGAAVANVYARRMVVPPHRDGGQAQYIDTPVPCTCDDDDLVATLAWASANLDRDLTVDELARRARLAPRTFARRFKAATGTTPLQWLLHQRVVEAQRLLESSDLPVDMVAERCGFGSAATLRMHFSRVVGTSPNSYRRVFRRAS
jgi:AraC family transcriptional activator FtrA